MKIIKKKVFALITAKKNSTELRNKNLRKINGKTLVELQIDVLKKVSSVSKIFISSDSQKILKIGKKKKISTILRPKYLATKFTSSELVLQHFIKFLLKKYSSIPEFILISQPTSPFTRVIDIKKSISKIKTIAEGSVVNIIKTPHKFHYQNQRTVKKSGLIKFLFKRDNKRRQDKIVTFVHGNTFVVCSKSFIKQKKILAKPIYGIKLNNPFNALDIDDIHDFNLAKIVSTYLKK